MRERFTIEQAAAWEKKYGWLVGCNFVPSYAVNQLDTWAQETFDEEVIDRELQIAEDLGFNTARIFWLRFFRRRLCRQT